MNSIKISDKSYSSVFDNDDIPIKYQFVLNEIGKHKKILELGCFDGFFSKKLIDNNNYVVGVDFDSDSLLKAKSICQEAYYCDLNNPETLFTNDIKEQQFDYILLMDVLEHLINPEDLLLKLRPFLNGNGRLIVSLPNIAYWAIRMMLLRGKFEYSDIGILDKTHLRFFTFYTAYALLQKNGFYVIKWEPLNYYVPFLGVLGLRRLSCTKRLTRRFEYCLAKRNPNFFSGQWCFLLTCNS